MGQIVITTRGSFPPREQVFNAITYGHTDAVAQAIEWLAKELLPDANALDHELHEKGSKPVNGFKRTG